MKIYFGASVRGKELYLDNYVQIVKILNGLGHEVLEYDFFNTSLEKVNQQTLNEKIRIHEKLGQLKLESDLVVMETSFTSIALGQEIAHAFRIGKPVLVLYTNGNFPHLILSDAGDRVLVSEYNLENMRSKIEEGIAYLKPQEIKRFTMNIPSALVDFLDRISKENKISRSDFIRNLLTLEMQKRRSRKT